MAGVRRGDWLVFLLALLVSALAYRLPVYTDGPFGTFNEYLAAFVAGAGGQVVFSTALLPLTRSYKAEGEVKSKEAATA